MAVVELTEGPGTTASYLRAVSGLIGGGRFSGGRRSTLPDYELRQRGVTVDRDHLARYDRICGFRLTDTLPATYPHLLAFPLAMRLMSAPEFPLPLIGLVHVANRITMHGPLDADAPLDLTVRAVELRPHPRGRQFDVVATATVDGVEMWRGVSTYLRKEASPDKREPKSESAPADADPSGALWRVPARVGGDYAAVSGDRNPIHTSRLGARLFGFPRPIAHGMWSKARCLAALEGRLPDACTVDVAFKQPILLPATVRFQATPAADTWEFAVRSKRPHLAGTVRAPA